VEGTLPPIFEDLAMQRRINPFNELYVTESISSAQFVKIFSSALIKHAEPLFLPGNVILTGVQGTGKSMLLDLLKPEVRVAYARLHTPYPVDEFETRFIGAGINLIRSRAIDFGQRKLAQDPDEEILVAPLFFSDFLNNWLVLDILRSIEKLTGLPDDGAANVLCLRTDQARRDHFASLLSRAEVWMGCLDGVSTWEDLKQRLAARIAAYFAFLNFNTDALPREFHETKTRIGEPVDAAADLLKTTEITPENVHIFLQIDQFETLCRLEGLYSQFGPLYRRMVNKALGLRNPSVSYRIGTRAYALEDDVTIYGTTATLEKERNYKLLDLDGLLRRQENARGWIFPAFAADVLSKRLDLANYKRDDRTESLERIFGHGQSPTQRAALLAGEAPRNAVRVEPDWPEQVRDHLLKLAETHPLDARLTEAWIRQQYRGEGRSQIDITKIMDWKAKPWWIKERTEQALIQIAGRCRGQRLLWSGAADILQLSGGNILVFVSICQHIWGLWLRSAVPDQAPESVPHIADDIQALGVHEASTHWFNKLPEESDGNTRQRFISYVANLLERKMIQDVAMSNPGHNGFSISLEELERDKSTKKFLEDAVDYGALFDSPHTTKTNDRKPRRKFYLNPILTPHFRLPHIRTKEPYYVAASDVRKWILLSGSGSDSSILPQQQHVQSEFIWRDGEES
jgi:hypothetical protein